MKAFACTLILSAAFAASSSAATAEYTCFTSLRTFGVGPFEIDTTSTLDHGSVLALQSRTPHQGLLFLLEEGSCAYDFPTTPVAGIANNYHLHLSAPGIADFFTGVQLASGEDPSVVFSPAPLEGDTYINEVCSQDVAEAAATDFLASKILAAPDFYAFTQKICHSNGNCRPKQLFIQAVQACLTVPALKPVVEDAVKRLKALP